jgi:Zn-dependent protease
MEEKKENIRKNLIARRLAWYLIAAITATLNYYIFYFLAQFLGAKNPGFIAIMLTSAVVVHEVFHYIAFELNGIPAKMYFLILMGGTTEFKEYKEDLKNLAWEKYSIAIMAGILGNFIVIAFSLIFCQINYLTFNEFLAILNLNGVLILYNLIPLWPFDGGYFARMLFDSIAENRDTHYEIAILGAFMGTLILVLFITGNLDLISFLIIPLALHIRVKRDNPLGSKDPKAIPISHQKWWAALYLILILISAIMVANTTSWIFLIS